MSFNKFFEKFAEKQEKHPILILFVTFGIVLAAFLYSISLETDPSFDTVLPLTSHYNDVKNTVINEFGVTDTMFILIEIDQTSDHPEAVIDVLDPRVLDYIKELESNLNEADVVVSTSSIASFYPVTPSSTREAKQQYDAFPDQKSLLVNNDFTATNVIIQSKISTKTNAIGDVENLLIKKMNDQGTLPGIKTELGGLPPLLRRILNLLIIDNVKTVALAMGLVAAVLLVYYRDYRLMLLSLVPVTSTLILLTGTMALFDIKISFSVAAVGAMMVGIGVDYSIHIAHEYIEEKKRKSPNPLRNTMRALGKALFASSLTTFLAFMVMLSGSTPSTRIQGIVLALGIFYSFITTIVIMPILLHLYSSRLKLDHHTNDGWRHKLLSTVSYYQANRPWTVILVVFLATLLLLPGTTFLRFDTDNSNWIPENDPVFNSFQKIGDHFGGTDGISFIITVDQSSPRYSDVRHPDIVKATARLQGLLERTDYALLVNSYTDSLKAANDGIIPDDEFLIRQQIQEDPVMDSFFNDEYTISRISVISHNFGTSEEENDAILNDIRSVLPVANFPSGVHVEPFGDLTRFEETTDVIQQDVGKTTMLGFVLILFAATILYRSFTAGAVALFPLIIGLIWTVSIMGWVDVPFTVLTSGILSLALGLGVDYSIHLTNMFKFRISEGDKIDAAVEKTMSSTGSAILTSAMTTFLGFLSLGFATLLVTQRLGYSLAIVIVSIFILCMLLVPSILVIEQRRHGA